MNPDPQPPTPSPWRSRISRRALIGGAATVAGAGLLALAYSRLAPEAPPPPSPVDGEGVTRESIRVAAAGPLRGIPPLEGLGPRGAAEVRAICHAPLSHYDERYRVVPVLAERLPSPSDGTWTLNPDGTMRLTWRLRRDARWHDGHPFTSGDVRFSWELAQDPSLPHLLRPTVRDITAMDLPDDSTVVMHWRAPNPFAHLLTLDDLFLYPEHILRPAWESGDDLLSHPFFAEGFVGLGPYRIERWEGPHPPSPTAVGEEGEGEVPLPPGGRESAPLPLGQGSLAPPLRLGQGSLAPPLPLGEGGGEGVITFQRVEGFVLGRPRIETVYLSPVADPQEVLEALVAGEYQVALAGALTFKESLSAREVWQAQSPQPSALSPQVGGEGRNRVLYVPGALRWLVLNPQNPLFQDPRVRRALLMAIDRGRISRELFEGFAGVARAPVHPGEPGFWPAHQAAPAHPFDPRRALFLLQEAGWRRGADDFLENAAGERFLVVHRVSDSDREGQRVRDLIAEGWREVGIQTAFETMVDALARQPAERARFTGATQWVDEAAVASLPRHWHSRSIPRPEDGFAGENYAHWSHPEADRLLGQIAPSPALSPQSSVLSPALDEAVARFAALFGQELPALPLYFTPEPVAADASVRGFRPRAGPGGIASTTWNIHQWG